MIIYGRNAVREALRGRRRLLRVWGTRGALREPWLADGPSPREVAADELARLCGTGVHQGLCAEVEPYPYVPADELLAVPDALIIALDQVQDPQNLGAVCRSAECAGATGVVICERRAAEITPAVCKASAGAVEHLAIARVRNLADFLADAKRAGCWCYGASAAGSVPYDQLDYRGPVVIVLGAEGRGLRPRVAGACDQLLRVPLRGRIASLNVSAAAAVIVYEALQRRAST